MLIDPVGDYARDVAAGVVITGPYVRAACRRHLNDLVTAEARAHIRLWDRARQDRGF